jgi:predicted SnoaL-like aldol condensation-catalyzing enzyme
MNNSNKKLVLDFYKQVVGGRNGDLIDSYISDNYIQHSPSMKDGKAGLRDAIEYLKLLPKPQEQKSPIVLAIAEGDFVMLLLDLNFMGKRLAVVDLFRLVDEMVVEHWDAMQDISSTGLIVPALNIDEGAILNEVDNAVITKHLNSRQSKIHRTVTEGNIVGVQSEVSRSGKRYVSYDFMKIANSKIVQSWSVEQEIPDAMNHHNGMI